MCRFSDIMKSRTVILLLLECISVNACTHGDIRITGVSSDTILAGYVDLCYQSEWRAICQNNWDKKDTMVLCRELGFPQEGAQIFCIESCLGRNDSINGINNFQCSGSENRTVDCAASPRGICGETIGVICSSSTFDVFDPSSLLPTTSATEPDTTSTSSSSASPTTALSQHTPLDASPGISAKVDGSTTEASLGGVVVVLLIILVGVAIGWVLTCHKMRPSRTKVNALPAYTTPPTSPLHSEGYSSQGPRNKLRNNILHGKMHAPESYQGIYEVPAEGNYDVVRESSDAEDDVYHELENTREGKRSEMAGDVSIPTKGEDISKELSVYSTLQHN